jgi:2-methylcitrate dehydratase PrpD
MSTPAHSSASHSRGLLGGDSHARRLLEFAQRLAQRPLPPPLAAQAKRCLLDNLGCGLFGANQPWSRIMRAEIESDAARSG